MIEILPWIFGAIVVFGITFLVIFLGYSIVEHERFAAKRVIPVLLFLIFILVVFILNLIPVIFQFLFILTTVLWFTVVILPFGNKSISFKIPENKFDERDVMFSRMVLKEGSNEFKSYYQLRPEKKSGDDLFRKEPGLLNPGSKFYNEFLFKAAEATFSAVEQLQPLVDVELHQVPDKKVKKEDISIFLKNWGIKLGAHSIGFTLLKPHHIYSHIGRGVNYGEEINLNHKYAIVFTVEMDHEFINRAPKGPAIMESAQQYLNAGTIAVQIAQFLRNIGYGARAHIDANYRIICPIVAQDAGLGSMGRMGLLMTPKLGPRVRIAVVTTNLELELNTKPLDLSVVQFCEICRKCAENCPSQSISFLSSGKTNEWERWKIDHEKCFTYWCKMGTDCGKCIAVCPYSHPNNLIHNLVRWFVRRNRLNRWLALYLDNYFYGKNPASKPLFRWMSQVK